MKTLKFRNGDEMQSLGLGTWASPPGEVYKAVRKAIEIGYRHIDCAHRYGNEAEIGQALTDAFKAGDVRREELWITSKLWNSHHQKHVVLPALHKSLKDLQLDYLDLYLMHWPIALRNEEGLPQKPEDFFTLEEVPLLETWNAMLELVDRGLVRHVGVSNFSIKKLIHLIEESIFTPEMNQIEMHPFFPQGEMLAFCRQKDIHLTAYSPLGSPGRSPVFKGDDEPHLLADSFILAIAQKHRCTPAQVLIKWALERGTAVVPKSVNPQRIKENFDAQEVNLDQEDMRKILDIDLNFRLMKGEFWCIEGSPYTQENIWDEG